MKSPFLGMDPYLERHWEDVHVRLIGYIRDSLQFQLPADLVARAKGSFPESGMPMGRCHVADIAEWQSDNSAPGIAAVIDPLQLEPVGDPIRERSVLIYDAAGNRIVTAIEVLSPWNKKPGKDLEKYLEKREKYINSEMNLVEIDLIRTGDWTEMIGPYLVPDRGRTTYRVTVTQPELTGPLHYPISIRAKLPRIKVPLRPHDAPAMLDLQELIDKAYVMGRYDRIDYSKPCTPPFIGPEQEWASEILGVLPRERRQ